MGKNNRKRKSQKKCRQKKWKKELQRKSRVSNKKPQSFAPIFQLAPNPFEGLSEAEHAEVIKEIASNSEKIYSEALGTIVDIFKKFDPTLLLSILANYGLTTGVTSDGVTPVDSDAKISQSHIEICQGLALQICPDEFQYNPAPPAVIQELWDAVTELARAHNFRDIGNNYGEESVEEKAVRTLQHWMKSNTMMVRNWGYFFQVPAIAKELYGYFDDLLLEHYGYTANNIIDLFLLLIEETEKANTARFITLSKLRKVKNKRQLVHNYHKLIGAEGELFEEFFEKIDIKSLSLKQLFMLLLSHHDLSLSQNYEFHPAQIAQKLNITIEQTTNILNNFSLEWGSLEEYETEFLYLANPVWLHPLLGLDESKYFCAFPQVFFSFIIPSLDELLVNIDTNALSDRRSEYLENKILEIINRRFPESNTVSGIKWSISGIEYETDLITFVDSHIIIVEAKSGRITDPALRGAPSRLKKHIQEILIAPNEQSQRLKDRLEELISNPDLDDDLRNKLPVDLDQIHKIIRLSVSLEDFASIQANIAQIKETGWLPENFEPCPSMNLADLETLFDFLDHPVQILHYLEGRQKLEKSLGYMGCELDLMGLYIGTLFNLGDIDNGAKLVIFDMSAPIDRYYNSKSEGIKTPKPIPQINKLFYDIMKQLEQRSTPRWTEVGVVLNNISPDDQRKLTKMVPVIKRNVKKNWGKEGHKNMIICVPPKSSSYAICYVLYCSNNANRRDEFIQGAAQSALEADHVKQCLVVAKNIDKDDLKYHFIGLLE